MPIKTKAKIATAKALSTYIVPIDFKFRFVQNEKFVEFHGGKTGDIFIYDQQSNATPRLAGMNLALRGIDADFGPEHGTLSAATSIQTSAATTSAPTRPSTTPTGLAMTPMCAGNTACRRKATPTSPGCSTSFTTSR